MSNQVNKVFVGMLSKTFVYLFNILIRDNSVPNPIEEGYKLLIILTIHFFELYEKENRGPKCLALKEVSRVIKVIQNFTITLIYNRRQLLYIADHHDLDATKWTLNVPDSPESGINMIQHIRTNHRYLINNEQVKTINQFSLSLCKS